MDPVFKIHVKRFYNKWSLIMKLKLRNPGFANKVKSLKDEVVHRTSGAIILSVWNGCC